MSAPDGAPAGTAQGAAARGSVDYMRFGGEAALVVGAGAFSNILSYVFHFVLSRRLGPEHYGTLVALMSIAGILAVLGGSLGTVAMQESARMWAAHQDAQLGAFLRRAAAPVTILALVVALVLFGCSFALGPYVHVTDPRLWLTLAAYVGVAVATAFARGVAQGAHRFGVFAASLAGEGITKVGGGYGFVAAGLGVVGALAGLLASMVVALLVAIVPMSSLREASESTQSAALDHLRLGVSTLRVLGITAASSALLFIDMLFAKHHFSGEDAGYFGAAGTLARMLPFGISLISLVVMPKAAAAAYAGRRALARVLGLTAAASFGAIVLGSAALVVFGQQLILLTYGSAFAPAAGVLRAYTLDEALFALWLAATSYLVALARYAVFPFLLCAVVVEATCFALFGSTPLRLLSIAIGVNAVLVPIVWWLAIGTLGGAAQASIPPRAENMTSR
ncbi:MAG TPA: oligosaccharide flippase family protein [Candidatus Acidoferrales bacterium]|nr:oligosaccharide flippase family protein [Candidatus Acidoferrales bacterium]